MERPFLIVKANVEYQVYQLQDCSTHKLWPSWIHAENLKPYSDSRELFHARTRRDVTKALGLGESASATAELQPDGRVADKPASDSTATSAANEYIRSSSKSLNPHATAFVSKQPAAAAAAAGKVTATRSGASVAPATAAATATGYTAQSVNNSNSAVRDVHTPADSEWHELRTILCHKKRGQTIYFKVQWLDGTTDWLPERDVTQAALDNYWVEYRAKLRRSPRLNSRK